MCLFFIPIFLYNKYCRKFVHVVSVTYKLDIFRKTAVPSICNIIGQACLNQGLIYVPATVWQIFYGFQILFATLFSVTIRKRQLFLVDWLSLFISTAGLAFSGVAALLRGIASDSEQPISSIFFSIIILIFAHGIIAFQTILEERLLHDEDINSATLTACEGVWGVFFLTFIVLPLCSVLKPTSHFYEDSIETFQMIAKSGQLAGLIVGYLMTVTGYSFCGIQITRVSSAIHRNMYEMVRPLPVWLLSLFIYYVTTNNEEIGEPLDKFSILEMCGFSISIIGSLFYNRVLKFSCLTYVDKEEVPKNAHNNSQSNLLDDKNALLQQPKEQ